MKITLARIKKFRASLGPVEQAQVVASIAVVVAMATIVSIRVFSGYYIDWLLFGSVVTVGVFGFIIVFFTLKYGQQLEEQKRELLALNTIGDAVNRSVEITYLLQNALHEVRRLLDVELGWIYHVEGGRLVLKASEGTEDIHDIVLRPQIDVEEREVLWMRIPRIQRRPRRATPELWKYGEIGAWASVPIKMKDRFEGIVIVGSKAAAAFSRKELDLMTAFANQIGVALENATLFEQLRDSEERYMDLFEHSPDLYHIVDRDGTIISCNQTEADRLGYRKNEIVGHSVLKLYPESYRDTAEKMLREVFESHREISGVEEQMLTKAGGPIDVSINTSIIYDEDREPISIRVAARDITEKKKMESKIIHAQRIDSIGNLAGGVAHDFNNILTSILGSTAIIKRRMSKANVWYHFVDIIETAAKRGAGLTRQLLTFARKSTVQFRPIVVNSIIQETLHLFERSIDKRIEVRKDLASEMSIIHGDEGQIQQAILNVLINARDAMPNGGVITVRSEKIKFDEQQGSAFGEVKSGDFASISIVDTGIGMDRTVQQHIFEPFFTTKDQGKGTGLGLSVVYGVMNSHGGFITVRSEPGVGSQFSLFFPLLSDAEKLKRPSKQARLQRGDEHVLVVDDEEHVGEVISGMLTDLGYQVTIARSGTQALSLMKKGKAFDVVVLDINMPTMGGDETFSKIKELKPDICVVVSTGYSNASLDNSPLRNAVDGFLQKPYQLEELSKSMRDAIDRKGNGA